MNEMVYWLAIQEKFWLFYPRMLEKALKEVDSIEKVWTASEGALLKWGMTRQNVERFVKYRRNVSLERFERMLEEISQKQIKIIPYTSPEYPKILKSKKWLPKLQPPRVLFHKGTILKELDEGKSVAIIGKRKCSELASEKAYEFGKELAEKGFIVVSGLAVGVDTQAHRGAIEAGGKTAAALPWMLPIYPSQNSELAEKIIKQGCLLSEVYNKPKENIKWRIWERNKITTGLSTHVIVIETGTSGGTVNTAINAIRQGIKTYILKLKEWSADTLRGFEKLEEKGAIPIKDVDDFLKQAEKPKVA